MSVLLTLTLCAAAVAQSVPGAVSSNPRTGLSPGITARLSRASWIPAGARAPKRVVYVFTDPECPYCNVLWKELQRADLSTVQIRYLMVAVIRPTSRDAAAAILESRDPAAALAAHERRFPGERVTPQANISRATGETLSVNFSLMDSLGIYATPALVYDDEDGRVSIFHGVPETAQLQKILQPAHPAHIEAD